MAGGVTVDARCRGRASRIERDLGQLGQPRSRGHLHFASEVGIDPGPPAGQILAHREEGAVPWVVGIDAESPLQARDRFLESPEVVQALGDSQVRLAARRSELGGSSCGVECLLGPSHHGQQEPEVLVVVVIVGAELNGSVQGRERFLVAPVVGEEDAEEVVAAVSAAELDGATDGIERLAAAAELLEHVGGHVPGAGIVGCELRRFREGLKSTSGVDGSAGVADPDPSPDLVPPDVFDDRADAADDIRVADVSGRIGEGEVVDGTPASP